MENGKKNVWVVGSDEQLTDLVNRLPSDKCSVTSFKSTDDMKSALGNIKSFDAAPSLIIYDDSGDKQNVIEAAKGFIVPIPVIIHSIDSKAGTQLVNDGTVAGFMEKPYRDGNRSFLDEVERVINSKKSIWIVNSNEFGSNQMRETLEWRNHDVIVFKGMEDSIKHLENITKNPKAKKPDLIIVENNYTSRSKNILQKAIDKGIRTIVQSSTDIEKTAEANHIMGVVLKSDTPKEFLAKVNKVLSEPAPSQQEYLSVAQR